tara:strand:- start:304 stop:444 length:141 start_codon:yes stop_codon:yes gene_type:complete
MIHIYNTKDLDKMTSQQLKNLKIELKNATDEVNYHLANYVIKVGLW